MRRFSAAEREDLADLRTVLKTAVHNVGAAIDGEEPEQALANALRQAEQAVATLTRLTAGRPGA